MMRQYEWIAAKVTIVGRVVEVGARENEVKMAMIGMKTKSSLPRTKRSLASPVSNNITLTVPVLQSLRVKVSVVTGRRQVMGTLAQTSPHLIYL